MRRAGASSASSLAVAPDAEARRLPHLQHVDRVLEGDARVAHPDRAVVRDRVALDGEQHVARAHGALGRPAGRHAVDDDARAPLRQPALAPVGRGQQRRRLQPRVREAVVAAVLQVGEEVAHDRDRDEEAHVVGAREALERDAHDAAVLHHRPAAVARVDRGVGLDHEVRVGAAVHVAARLDARDDAGGGRDVLAAEREAVGVDARAGARQRAEPQRPQARARRPGRRRAAPRGRSRCRPPRRVATYGLAWSGRRTRIWRASAITWPFVRMRPPSIRKPLPEAPLTGSWRHGCDQS